MGITTAAKMLSGIAVFVIMARILGPRDLGLVTYTFALTSIFVLLVDYGFSQQLLRDIGANPHAINELMGRVLIAKLILSVALLLICAVYLAISPKNFTTEIVFITLLLSSLLASFSEFLNVGFRGVGQFNLETNLATLGAIIHFLLVVAVLLVLPNVYCVGFAFIASRFIYLYLSWYAYHKYLGNITIPINVNEVTRTLKTAFPYAANAGFTSFFYQVDTIIVNHYLGFAGVGLYHAATKWVQGVMQFAPVLSNVYLPALAASAQDRPLSRAISIKLNIQMLAIGFLSWAFFTFFGLHFSILVYGDQFKEINTLWPYIGLLIWVRYVAGSQGVMLVAAGQQVVNIVAQAVALVILLVSAPILIKASGLSGFLLALSLAIASILFISLAILIKKKVSTGFNTSLITFVISITLLALVCVFWKEPVDAKDDYSTSIIEMKR